MIGGLGALALGRVIGGLRFGVIPTAATTMALAALVLAATAVLASCVPARRATRIDPARVLGAKG